MHGNVFLLVIVIAFQSGRSLVILQSTSWKDSTMAACPFQCLVFFQIERLEVGVGNGAERSLPPGIQAQHPAPAPHASHARHDRLMARNRLVARPNSADFPPYFGVCSATLSSARPTIKEFPFQASFRGARLASRVHGHVLYARFCTRLMAY